MFQISSSKLKVALPYSILTRFEWFSSMLYPLGREQMQPSLALSMLALSSLMQSLGSRGAISRDRALVMLAQSFLVFVLPFL